MEPDQGGHLAGARQPGRIEHLGDRPDLGVVVAVTRQHEDPLLVADLGSQSGGHAGEQDGVVKRNQEQLHGFLTTKVGLTSTSKAL